MNTAVTHTWPCPQCQRRVPARETICHCGFDRAKAAARDARRASAVATAPAPRKRPSRVLVYGGLLLVALGSVIYASLRAAPGDPEPAAPAPGDDPRPRSTMAYAPLPTVPAADVRPIDSGRAVPSASMPEAWSALKLEVPPSPPGASSAAPEPGGQGRAAASPEPLATPTPTSMEEAWSRATEVLDPQLRKLAAETGALEAEYRSFPQACEARAPGASSGSSSGNWLAALKAAAASVGREQSGIPLNDLGPTVDCQALWKNLVARADTIKARLGQAEDAARKSGVLPGHWRTLLGRYRLDAWDDY
jgi:hypothetical protein